MTIVAPTAVYFNGKDAAALGFVLSGVIGAFDATDRTDQRVEFPQGVGDMLSSAPGRIAARQITIEGTLPAVSRVALESAKQQLKALCSTGTVAIRLVSANVVFYGRLVGMSVSHFSPQLRDGRNAARVSLRFLCADPFGWDEAPQLVGFGATAVAMPLGTAPSRGRSHWSAVVTIHGPATTPTLTETDAGGNTLGTMAFTWSPTANDAIEIDIGRGLVTRVQSGVRDNGLPYVTAGFKMPRLDPDTGYYLTSAWPRLAVSSGVGVSRHWRAWR